MRRAAAALAFLTLLAFAGCGPATPLDRRISAESPLDFDIWQSRHIAGLSPRHALLFQKSRDELQLFVVTQWQGRSVEEQRRKLRDQMHGFTVRDFIVQGHQLGILRRERLLEDQRRLLALHEEMLRGPETVERGHARVRSTVEMIVEQIHTLEREIAENEAVIRELRPEAVPVRPIPKAKSPH